MLNQLTKWICPTIIWKCLCGLWSSLSIMDMIYFIQLKEKCIQHHIALYQIFVNFNTVLVLFLRTIFRKLCSPPQFVHMSMQLHCGMKAHVNFNGSVLKPIFIDNEVVEKRKILYFGLAHKFISTLNFTQSGWLILFSPDLHFRLAKWESGQTHSLWLETATRTDVRLAVPA